MLFGGGPVLPEKVVEEILPTATSTPSAEVIKIAEEGVKEVATKGWNWPLWIPWIVLIIAVVIVAWLLLRKRG